MRIAHLSWLLSPRGGGIPPVMTALAGAQQAAGNEIRVMGVADPLAPPIDASCLVFPARGPLALGWAPGLAPALQSYAPDLLHLHGLFTWSSQVTRDWRRRTGRPVVVSPHGMLEPWALANSAWKKKLFSWLIERDNLCGTACLHALSDTEAASIRQFGLRNPIAVLPNGIDLSQLPKPLPRGVFEVLFPVAGSRRVLLFLGRLHPKKGLPHLLQAWAAVRSEGLGRDWRLAIAGPDQLGHASEIRIQARALGLDEQVFFAGPLQGEQKWAALSAASGFVLPSFSEGFPVAVLEAMAFGLPVLLTRQCNLDVQALGAGLLCEPTADSVAAQLRSFFSLSETEWGAMGRRGRQAVEARYTWQVIARAVDQVYAWVLGGGDPPPCVQSAL